MGRRRRERENGGTGRTWSRLGRPANALSRARPVEGSQLTWWKANGQPSRVIRGDQRCGLQRVVPVVECTSVPSFLREVGRVLRRKQMGDVGMPVRRARPTHQNLFSRTYLAGIAFPSSPAYSHAPPSTTMSASPPSAHRHDEPPSHSHRDTLYEAAFGGEGSDLSDLSDDEPAVPPRRAFPPRPVVTEDDEEEEDVDRDEAAPTPRHAGDDEPARDESDADDEDGDDDVYVPGTTDYGGQDS